jgi:hypothetical protein
MDAFSSATDSALCPRGRKRTPVEPHRAVDQALFVIVLDTTPPGQHRLAVLRHRREQRGAPRVLILAVYDEERKALPVQTEGEKPPRKICQQPNPKCIWINAAVWTLLASCCTVTLFFAFQAPFRLRANENQTSAVEFRAETAAPPARLGTQTISRLRPSASDRGGGYDKEVASSSVDDTRHKRRLSRERLVRRKQPRVCIQSGQFSGHR